MILDPRRFIESERGYWKELESVLDRLDANPGMRLTLEETERFHYLYERCSADLARMGAFAGEPETHRSLEALVSRAYAEIHETRERRGRIDVRRALSEFPRVFRRRARAFALALSITLAGTAFGATALLMDPEAKQVLMPFPGLMEKPANRVAQEESRLNPGLEGGKATFSAQLMTHNIQVAFTALALGVTWGIGSVLLLFYNGVILGAVAADYVAAGQSTFLTAWLLPHGAVEIPAILVGGQAAFVLAGALIGWGSRTSRRDRLRTVGHDLLWLAGGVAVMLVWAGIVEAFLSQYHHPVVPYSLKIAFGAAELVVLTLYLWRAGRS